MRIKYIFFGGSLKGSSVQEKLKCQVQAMNRAGHEVSGLMFTSDPSIEHGVAYAENVHFYKLKPYNKKHKYFHDYYEMQFHYREIQDYLHSEEKNHDLLYVRHGSTGYSYLKMLNKLRDKLVLYVPSNTIPENYLDRKYAAKTSMAGFLIRWFEFVFYYLIWEKWMFAFITSKLKAVVAFTPEFSGIIRKRSFGECRTFYNRDGADCARVTLRKPTVANEDVIKLLFMKGSSMLQPWSGLERLVKSIAAYPDIKIELYITGSTQNTFDLSAYPFVITTGRLEQIELNKLINEVDLGVSNLANYMIGFNETTNLKSREYFACGLPFIQANTMPDITGTEAEKFYLLIPNDDSIIPMDSVRKFALKMREDNLHPEKMRKFAEAHLDWNITGNELAQILAQV